MDPVVLKFGLWLMVLTAVLVAAGMVIWRLRKALLTDEEDENDEDSPPLLTTAEVDRLKSEGLLTDKQYARLQNEAREAAKKRAEQSKKRGNKKRGLLG